jgi:hypothetical protein
MKTVVIVAPHFFPSFLAAVHRARLWAYHLPEFGWEPIIVTTDPRYYECQVDEELNALLPPELTVIRTKAIPTRPIRLVGNLGFRSAWWYYAAIKRLARERRIDFVHITCDSFPASLIGPFIQSRLGIPYGIDYQDPWIPETAPRYRPLSKPWLANKVSRFLEPIAVRGARLITGINDRYFASMLDRNPQVRARAVTAGMPFGSSPRDFEYLASRPRRLFLFDPADGNLHLVYAGALLPQGHVILERLLEALAILRRDSAVGKRLRVHFVGTGLNEGDPARGHTVRPYAEKWGVAEMVDEYPARIPFMDVLNHLRASSAVLVLGSLERHYSPSKIYQGALSGRPVFAILHAECTAAGLLTESRAGRVFGFTPEALPDARALASALEAFLAQPDNTRPAVDWAVFERDSARSSARLLASALDEALARHWAIL